MVISRPVLLRIRKVSEKFVEKIKTRVLCSITVFRKSCQIWVNVVNCCRDGQTTDDYMVHTRCMMNAWGYKQTLRICNNYCFPRQQWLGERGSMLHLYVLVRVLCCIVIPFTNMSVKCAECVLLHAHAHTHT